MNLYYTKSHGPDQLALKKAYLFAIQLAQSSGLKQIYFGGHTRKQLKANTFEKVFGKTFVKKLQSGSVIQNNIEIKMFTERINPPSYADTIIFVPHISKKYLLGLISDNPDAIIIINPWAESELNYIENNFPSAKVIK